MSDIDVEPLVLTDYVMTIDGDTYQKAIEEVTFTPKTQTINFHGGTPTASYTRTIVTGWDCGLSYVQDWETSGSLSAYLHDPANEGQTKAAIFKPQSGTGPTFTADLSVVPGTIGGKVNTFGVTKATLGSTRPVLVPAP